MRSLLFLIILILVVMIAFAGCGGKESEEAQTSTGQLKLIIDDEETVLFLEMMDIFLVEDESYAETYEIRGPDVLLVGEFPLDVHVDYEADLSKLRDREIEIQASGGERGSSYGEPQQSILALPGGEALAVVGGSFVVEKTTGPRKGLKGDGIISGTISLQVQDGADIEIFEGTFSVSATTWG